MRFNAFSAAASAAIFLGACTVAGCAGPQRHTDTLVIDQQHEPIALNPALENGPLEWGLILFQYLVKFDDRGRLIGDAAIEAPTLANGGISRDGLTVTYHLRKGLRFSDGVPLTAKDCVYSINAINDPANNVQSRYAYDRVALAEAPNAYTLVLHLKRPFAPLVSVVMTPQGFPILPEHALVKYHNFNRIPFDDAPIGSGPYRVVRWVHGEEVDMEANPYYYQGPPKISHLIVRFVPNGTTAMNQLRTGEADGIFNDPNLGDYSMLRSVSGIDATATLIDAVGALIFNTQDPITSDARVRQALSMAIDVPSMVTKAYRGALDGHEPGRGLFMWAYDPKVYTDVPYDPAAANRLLDEAGWKRGPDGVRRKDGKPLDLLLILQANSPYELVASSVIASYEHAIGAVVTLKQYQVTVFAAPVDLGGPVYGGKFQMALYPFTDGDDPDTTDQFACKNVPPHGYNKSRFCDPRVDALLSQGQSTFDQARRREAYVQLEGILREAMPIMLLYQQRQLNAFTTRLHGQTTSLSGAFWNVADWTLQ
ncbi:MAG TPA: peptide ABC transporter substrate-binding protein [Candidatus Eremiobacteraceae bacterium]|nr:peptide ABC transporter substrate-binding protein [Candidatus Eremiobacteraceae bacterium]